MQFVTVRDFRNASKAIWDKIKNDEEVVVTNNGKPTALLINIRDDDFDETIESVRQAKAMRALYRMRTKAEERGFMSEAEIEAEISAARSEYEAKTGHVL
ncbi:MAG: type II toxin-antitoxin system Phd/YefM family antitoxin [Oscillospiraceae bacterium]|jgi:prevent-host-death family protein|nr:type II toxin-antitoxin system Phd/YefM family antitoxin [Oscillospiraceae bacterium]